MSSRLSWLRNSLLLGAFLFAMPFQYVAVGSIGGTDEPPVCNTFSFETPDCSGSACTETWRKCKNCDNEHTPATEKWRCKYAPDDACQTAGCTSRREHVLSDDCIENHCPAPNPL